MRSLGLVVLLCVGLVRIAAAAPTAAPPPVKRHARPATANEAPIAVLPFTGLHGDEPQAAVLKALGTRAALVKPAEVAKAQPYVIVSGGVVRRGTGLIVEIDVVDAATKNRVGQVTMPIPASRHLPPEQLAELARQVDELTQTALSGSDSAQPAEPAETQPPDENAPPPPEPPSPQAQDTERAGNPAPLETSTPIPIVLTPPPPKRRLLPDVPRPRWYPWLEASVGAIVDSRRLAFHPSTPPAYHPGTGGGIHVDVTLYPLAFLHAIKHGVFAGLGAGITVDKPFWPTTEFEGTPNQYATAELRVEGGARWRFIVRKWRPRLEITVLGGAGLHTYTIAKATDPATGRKVDAGPPDVSYVYGQVGAGLRAVFWHERLMPWLSAAYEYFPDAGPAENVDEYGTSRTHGVMLRAGLDVRVWRRLRVGAAGFWELVGLSFTHDLATARTATRATDQFFGGIFTAGYDY